MRTEEGTQTEHYEAVALLPKVGDRRVETPAVGVENDDNIAPRRCTVVAVNARHLWYMVRFECGVRECYKAPAIKPGDNAGQMAKRE